MKRERRTLKNWLVVGFCSVYVLIQLFLIVRAHFSTDKRFGFWMFAESTIFSAELYRVTVDGDTLRTRNGVWRISSDQGRVVYSWNKHVRDYRLNSLERKKRAKGSINRTMFFFENALNYVIDRIGADNETRQLLLYVHYEKADGVPVTRLLQSKIRSL